MPRKISEDYPKHPLFKASKQKHRINFNLKQVFPSSIMAMQITPDGKVDRQVVTPFHLKLFYRTGGFHRYSSPLRPHPSTSPVNLQ